MRRQRTGLAFQVATSLVRDEGGQDLVEYALLTGFVGFAGVAAWVAIGQFLGDTYQDLNTAQQNLWEPDNPQ